MDKNTQIPVWYLLLPLMALLFAMFFLFERHGEQISYSEFKQLVAEEKVADLTISSTTIQGKVQDPEKPSGEGKAFYTFRVEDANLVRDLEKNNIEFVGVPDTSWIGNLLFWVIPFLLVFMLFRVLYQRVGPPQGLLSVGRSKAKLYVQDEVKTTFDDVAGVDEAKEELQEVVEFLQHPQKFQILGGKIPKGVLLVGPPGTGKTLLARAVAGEAKVPFFSISGSEFVEMFVGVGAARVRDLFQQAVTRAPCIVFVDELDALGKARGMSPQVSHDEREQTLNQLLAEMDGFDPRKGVIVMAATNRPEILDLALLRPGRFDRQILVDRPDVIGREAILRVHAKDIKLSPRVDLKIIAARTPGFAGADLANVLNEAALLAARRNKAEVEMNDLEEAIDRVLAGLEKKARVISAKEKEIVAYHESGHAIVAASLPHADPVHKISIIPRGIAALGYTIQLPTEDRYLLTRSELVDRLTVLLGGRCAEDLIFHEASTGAQDDLMKATDMARRMVTEYGMSERLGPVSFEHKRRPFFLPEGLPTSREYGEETARAIDHEVKALLEEVCDRARTILQRKQETLHRLAKILLDREVIEGPELQEILDSRGG
jgi:cell division protease FtsH